jgi:hypothetical protein
MLGAAAANYHDALFILAGGATGNGSYTDAIQVFRYCFPYVASMYPNNMENTSPLGVTIGGFNFDDQAGSEYYLEGPAKTRVDFVDLALVNSRLISATVPAGLAAGVYDLVACNASCQASGEAKTRPGVLTVQAPAPALDAIAPDSGDSGEVVGVTLTGNYFFGAPLVQIAGPAKTDITATNVVVVDINTITADFDLAGAAAGDYDVVVTTVNGSDDLPAGFTVNEATDDDTVPDDDSADDDTADDDTEDDDAVDDDAADDDIADDDATDDDATDDDSTDDDATGGGGSGDDDSGGCGC